MSDDQISVRLTAKEIGTIRLALEAYYRERPDDRRRGLKRLQDELGNALSRHQRARKAKRQIRAIELKIGAIRNRVDDIVGLAQECGFLLRSETRED